MRLSLWNRIPTGATRCTMMARMSRSGYASLWRAVIRKPRVTLFVSGILSAVGCAAVPAAAFAANNPYWNPGPPWAPLVPKSGEMLEISDLFWIVLVLSAIIFLFVAVFMIHNITRYTGKDGDPDPPQVFGNQRVELLWTLIPVVVLLGAFIATVKAIHDINTPEKGPSLDIRAIGHQWWWEFQYPKYAIDTAGEVHVPAGYNIHFHVESNDVIHSFWTPQLQRQIDANPAEDNAVFVKLDQPGIYSGMCYEYCGAGHSWMKYRLVVQPYNQFIKWVHQQEQPAAKPATSLQARGKSIFTSSTCINCHAITGVSGGAVGPNLTHLASRWAIGAGAAPMNAAAIAQWVQNPYQFKQGVLMPAYPLFSKQDLNALAAYLMSLK